SQAHLPPHLLHTLARLEGRPPPRAITQGQAGGLPGILRIMAESPAEIRTLGRLPVRPVRVLPGLGKAAESMDTLILVGGTTWDTGHEDILAIAGLSWRRARPWA